MLQADFLPKFKKNLARLPPNIQRQIQEDVNELCEDPYRGNIQLQGPEFGGIRRKRSGKYRIASMICKECLEKGRDAVHQCPDCGSHRVNFIRFFDVFLKKKGYARLKKKVPKRMKKHLHPVSTLKTIEEQEKRRKQRKKKRKKGKKR